MRIGAVSVLAFLCLVDLCGVGRSEPLSIRATAVTLHADDRNIARVGALEFLGGLHLTSSDPRFGGLSGLEISADGKRLSAVTDKGAWIHFTPLLAPGGKLTGVSAAQIGDLRSLDGKRLRRKRNSDAESLVAVDGGFVVSFERRHRVWLYRGAPNPFLARPTEIALPALAKSMSANKGLETLARLHDGRLIAIAENFPKEGSFSQGWFFKSGRWHGFRYRRYGPFQPAGGATSPDGRLLVLERRFSYIGGIGSRLVAVSPESIRSDADIEGQELARFERPLITENFEGIAAYGDAAGKTILYLISDNNFSTLLRTVLLRFALEG